MANKKRLIDANKLIEVGSEASMTDIFPDWNAMPVSVQEAVCTHGQAIKKMIQQSPTVDAVEVVHSKWDTVFYERNGTLASYSHLCPECKYFYRDLRFKGHNYCPNCGAKMDL